MKNDNNHGFCHISFFVMLFILFCLGQNLYAARVIPVVSINDWNWQTIGVPVNDALMLKHKMVNVMAETRGIVGAGVYNLKNGQQFYLNGNQFFPMASTYKVAIAVKILQLVQQNKLNLYQQVAIQPFEAVPGGGFSYKANTRGTMATLQALLRAMICNSDNTATDKLMSLAGGPTAVNNSLRALGIRDININRPTLYMIADSYGMEHAVEALPKSQRRLSIIEAIFHRATAKQIREGREDLVRSRQDASTPIAMIQLLQKIATNQALQPRYTNLLLEIMSHTRTGKNRIKNGVPKVVTVAHKTGTLHVAVCDVGYIMLPNSRGNIAIAVFVKENLKGAGNSAQAIAQIARITYSYFMNGRA
jgi:beta-lactamase class A